MKFFLYADQRSLKGSKGQNSKNVLKIRPNWLYLSLMKTDKAPFCHSDVTLMVEEVYDSLNPKGQSSRSKVKIYKQDSIELKFVRNNPRDLVNT